MQGFPCPHHETGNPMFSPSWAAHLKCLGTLFSIIERSSRLRQGVEEVESQMEALVGWKQDSTTLGPVRTQELEVPRKAVCVRGAEDSHWDGDAGGTAGWRLGSTWRSVEQQSWFRQMALGDRTSNWTLWEGWGGSLMNLISHFKSRPQSEDSRVCDNHHFMNMLYPIILSNIYPFFNCSFSLQYGGKIDINNIKNV